MWLRHNAVEVLFPVEAFELELLQPWDEKAFVDEKLLSGCVSCIIHLFI